MKDMRLLLSLVFLFSVHCASAENPEDSTLIPTSYFVTSHDDFKIHYRTMGEGEPIVLIHGFYANENINWFENGIAAELAKTHMVIAVDLRGHGQSAKPLQRKYYGHNMWKDVITVMNDLGVQKAHFHGYSMGGTILTQILYYKSERVISAIYGGSGIFEKDSKKKIKIKDKKPTAEANLREEKANRVLMEAGPNHVALYALRKNPPSGREGKKLKLTRLRIPVLAMNGEFDFPNKKTQRMERELRDFESVILPNEGHLSAITPGFMPNLYLESLAAFIRSHSESQ